VPTLTTDLVYNRGRAIRVPAVEVQNKRVIIDGKFLSVARLRDEWYDELGDPEPVISFLKRCSLVPDLFTFWQRLPDTVPMYSYYHEPEVLSAIPLKDFKQWWDKQIKSDTRKKARRAEKRGMEIKVVPLDDDFVTAVIGIFNDVPVRRGKPFWHYGKSFETVKEELSRDLATSEFIGAYDHGELVGFVKLVYAPARFANPGLIVSKLEARKKYVNNALIAKCVEFCCEHSLPYLTYTKWRRGTQAEFLIRHGFEKTAVPRYWIPLTNKGRIALKLGFHRDIRTRIPERLMGTLLNLRAAFYNRFYRTHRSDNVEELPMEG
jgi:hypothetical protein